MIPFMDTLPLPLWKALAVYAIIPLAVAGVMIWALWCAVMETVKYPYFDYPDVKPRKGRK